ncbi:MAG: radical SAM family heme chaperone HemW [Alphaproteobacteria bacterium]|nr:radical SAM family heme chaperone HemW [Alphaproteobacteria bacterium]
MKTPQNHLFGLYVHWPYCLSKCPYCGFASRVCTHPDETALIQGYTRDLNFSKSFIKHSFPLTSLYFGGGTPSLMTPAFLKSLIQKIQQHFEISKTAEITLEANPDAIDLEKMKAFRNIGVNRLSVGVQSLNPDDLFFLGRKHTVQKALTVLNEAKHIFPAVNMDLIYARPNQTLSNWQSELEQALTIGLNHYSLYQLSIDEGSVFYKQGIQQTDDESGRAFYELTDKIMTTYGCPAYEVSNYAKHGFKGRHNMTYWTGGNYIGIGPAAAGRIGLHATENPSTVSDWLNSGPLTTLLTETERFEERVLTGLRLRNHPFPTTGLSTTGIQKAIDNGWIIKTGETITTTLEGTLMLNTLVLTVLE